MNNMAPQYLQSVIRLRSDSTHNLRVDEDFYQLVIPPKPNIAKTAGCSSYIGPKLWNKLPYKLRCMTDIKTFKSKLKTHLYNVAFNSE